MQEERKKVDVVIPTYQPDKKVVLLLRKLLHQTFPVHEIHVINTESGIFPEEILSLSEKIRITHIPGEEFDHGGTRDRGMRESEAEIVVFMTQDALPVNDCLIEELVRPFEQSGGVAVSYGRQLPDADCRVIERYTRTFNYPAESCVKSREDLERLGIKTYFCSDVCAAYRKDVYEVLGGFEKNLIFNEDMIMAAKMIQAGFKVAYAAEAKVLHSHNYTCIQQFKRNFDLAVSQADHPEIFKEVHSEHEGIRLVKKTAGYLLHVKKPWLVGELVIKSGFKYLGYRMGKRYQKLPLWMIQMCTMNKGYWKEKKIH